MTLASNADKLRDIRTRTSLAAHGPSHPGPPRGRAQAARTHVSGQATSYTTSGTRPVGWSLAAERQAVPEHVREHWAGPPDSAPGTFTKTHTAKHPGIPNRVAPGVSRPSQRCAMSGRYGGRFAAIAAFTVSASL
ncbi:hypothetical protein GCM10023191_063300 [Actinoallomurus oryzae]|uniref:Uncharacterized protein n=1 Tax=Actinoallomurus oryzae TaxID=502180 RepID=A0ABP8QN62_9ACTN